MPGQTVIVPEARIIPKPVWFRNNLKLRPLIGH